VDFSPENQLVLKVSYGDGKIQDIATGLASSNLAVAPDGQSIIMFSAKSRGVPYVVSFNKSQIQSTASSIQLPYSLTSTTDYLSNYQVAWHPSGELVAFYNKISLFLSNIMTGQSCELDLGKFENQKKWASQVVWSPNGRFLAAITTVGNPPVPFMELTVYDITTGDQHQIPIKQNHDVYSVTWAPDSWQILIVTNNPKRNSGNELFLVNLINGDSTQVMGNYSFPGIGYVGLSWSPTGKSIAMTCPISLPNQLKIDKSQICVIPVGAK